MGKAATDGEAEITADSSEEDQVESEAEDNVLYSSSSDSDIDRKRSEEPVPVHQTAKNSGQGESGLHPRRQHNDHNVREKLQVGWPLVNGSFRA